MRQKRHHRLVPRPRAELRGPTADHGAAARLTAREREVLGLLAKGHIYADVARALSIGLGTVQGHVKSIYAKLEISSKAEAAAIAVHLGLA